VVSIWTNVPCMSPLSLAWCAQGLLLGHKQASLCLVPKMKKRGYQKYAGSALHP